MKKYFIGMLALVLAVGFSAFTKPSTSQQFTFTGTLSDAQNQNIVKDVSMWVNSSSCNTNVQNQACTIELTDPSFYHTEAGVGIILNDAAYAADQTNHPGAQEAVLSVSSFTGGTPSLTTYYVITSSVVSSVFNKTR